MTKNSSQLNAPVLMTEPPQQYKKFILQSMCYSRKNPHPHDGRHVENSHGRGVNSSGNSDGRRALNPEIHPWGLLSILLMFQLCQLISFQKIALRFPVLLFFQTTELLPYLFQVSIHRLTFITFVCFCRSDVR